MSSFYNIIEVLLLLFNGDSLYFVVVLFIGECLIFYFFISPVDIIFIGCVLESLSGLGLDF
jgi:hypothetical protein